MSTSAATPFRSFVQTPIFSVSPSSFSLQQKVINIIITIVLQTNVSLSGKSTSAVMGKEWPWVPQLSCFPASSSKPPLRLPFEL